MNSQLLTPDVFEKCIAEGPLAIRNLLFSNSHFDEVERLSPHYGFRDRKWIGAGTGNHEAVRVQSLLRYPIGSFASLLNPAAQSQMSAFRHAVQVAGHELGDESLTNWGQNQVGRMADGNFHVQQLWLRYYNMPDRVELGPHQDPTRTIGPQLTMVLSGVRYYMKWRFDENGNVCPTGDVLTLNRGDALLQMQQRDPLAPGDPWPQGRSWHAAMESTPKTEGVVAIIAQSRWPLAHVRARLKAEAHGFFGEGVTPPPKQSPPAGVFENYCHTSLDLGLRSYGCIDLTATT